MGLLSSCMQRSIERDPELTPSQIKSKAPPIRAISWLRIGPAALSYKPQAAGIFKTGIDRAAAQASPARSMPLAVPEITWVILPVQPANSMISSISSTLARRDRLPAMINFKTRWPRLVPKAR